MSRFLSVFRIIRVWEKAGLVLGAFALWLALFSGSAQAATFALSPPSGSFTQGCEVSVDILIDTQGIDSNAADAVLFYDPNDVEFIDQDASMPSVQVGKGNVYQIYAGNVVDDAQGRILLTGFNVLGGFNGSGIYGSMVFKSKPGVTSTQFTFDFTPGGSTDSNIADMASSDVLSGVTNANYTFTPGSCVPDTQAPQIVDFTPANGSADVPLSSNLSFRVTDNQSGVDINTLSVIAHNTTYTNGSPQMTVTGTALDFTIVINPSTDFPFNTEIVTTIGVEDVTGNVMPQRVFRFNAPDTQPPNVVNVNPANGAREIPLSSNVSFRLTDNETGVDLSTLSITLNGESYANTSSQVTITGTPTSQDVVINPDNNFPFNTQITLTVGVSDIGGNVMAPRNFSFNAPDQVPPSVINMNPPNGSGGIALDSSFSFNIVDNDTGVDLTTVLINLQGADYGPSSPQVTVSGTNLNYSIVLDSPADFTFGENVTLRVSASDLGGNNMTPQTFTFSTGAAPPICGNGIQESGEQCDDGNADDTDGCLSTCQRGALCGDNRVEGTEECEPPGSLVCDDTCSVVVNACTAASAPTSSGGGGGSIVIQEGVRQVVQNVQESDFVESVSDSVSRISLSVGLQSTPSVVAGVAPSQVKVPVLVCETDRPELVEIEREQVPYQPPAGFEVIQEPFSLNCDGSIDTVLTLPNTYTDVKAVKCVGGTCSDVVVRSTETIQCGGESLYTEEKETNRVADIQMAQLDQSFDALKYTVDAADESSDRRYSISRYPQGYDVTLHSSLRMLSAPVQVSRRTGLPSDEEMVRVSFPFLLDAQLNPKDVQIYALDENSQRWKLVPGGQVSDAGDVYQADLNFSEYAQGGDQAAFALLGKECDELCNETEFESVYQPLAESRAAIVFVHGLGSDASSWESMVNDIRRTQQPWQVWTYSYPLDMALQDSGYDFASNLEAYKDRYDVLYVVAHSVGGLVVQEAMTQAFKDNALVPGRFEFLEKVKRVVLMGTPNNSITDEKPLLTLYNSLLEKNIGKLFTLNDELTKSLSGKRGQYPKLPGVEYFVLAGNQDFGLDVQEGNKLLASESSKVGDGFVSRVSAQNVGGEPVDLQCSNYYELGTNHIDIVDDITARRIIGRLVSQDLEEYVEDEALMGFEQYYELSDESCSAEDRYVLIGKKVDQKLVPDGINCSCGNGYCGIDESPESCPQDCSQFLRKENFPYIFLVLLLLFFGVFGYALRKTWKQYQIFRHESAQKSFQKLSLWGKIKVFCKIMGVVGIGMILLLVATVYVLFAGGIV